MNRSHHIARGSAPFGTADAPGDYRILVATLQALQTATPTARAGNGAGQVAPIASTPLADILAGRPGWQDAVVAQGGSFNPAVARGRAA